VHDLNEEDRFPTFVSRALQAGLAAVFTFPLHHGDHQLGALDLYRNTPGLLSPDAISAARTLAEVVTAYIVNAQSRADLQEASDLSRVAALHDGLTGLANRSLMLERLEHALLRSRRSGSISGVFFLDLDRFKDINDTLGHKAGDQLLVAVGERLSAVLRPATPWPGCLATSLSCCARTSTLRPTPKRSSSGSGEPSAKLLSCPE